MSVFFPRVYLSQPTRYGGCGSSGSWGNSYRRSAVNPLWDLFDPTFDEIARNQARTVQQQRCQQRKQQQEKRFFNPRFDIKEGESAYTLEGELPGVAQEDIEIQFLDEATLQIKGHTETGSKTNETPVAPAEGEKQQAEVTMVEPERTPTPVSETTMQATVEDEDEANAEDWISIADGNEKPSARASSPASTPAPNPANEKQGEQQQQVSQQPKSHTWLSERRYGEFTRTFRFSERVDRDAVTASFRNGLLRIAVPKRAAPEARKINIE